MKDIVVVNPEDGSIEGVVGPFSENEVRNERYEMHRRLDVLDEPRRLYIVNRYLSFTKFLKEQELLKE